MLRLKSGATALIDGGWAYPPGVFRTGLDLSGTDGLIEWTSDQPTPLLTFFPPKTEETPSIGFPTSGLTDEPFAAELRHAYQGIQSGDPVDVTAAHALEARRIS